MFGCARTRASSARSISRPVASRWWTMRRRVCPPSRPRSRLLLGLARVELGAELEQRLDHRRPPLDHVANDGFAAEAGACRERVLDVLLEGVVAREDRRDPALGPVRRGVRRPLLGDDRDAAVLGDAEGIEEARRCRCRSPARRSDGGPARLPRGTRGLRAEPGGTDECRAMDRADSTQGVRGGANASPRGKARPATGIDGRTSPTSRGLKSRGPTSSRLPVDPGAGRAFPLGAEFAPPRTPWVESARPIALHSSVPPGSALRPGFPEGAVPDPHRFDVLVIGSGIAGPLLRPARRRARKRGGRHQEAGGGFGDELGPGRDRGGPGGRRFLRAPRAGHAGAREPASAASPWCATWSSAGRR